MKNKILKVLSIFILLAIFIGQFDFLKVIAASNSLDFIYESDEATPFRTNQGGSTKYRRVKLGTEPAYCVDYGRKLPTSSSLAYKGKMSEEALTVLVYGFPNNVADIESFGISKEREEEVAYLATQMAFWEVLTRTGEMTNGLPFYIDDTKANSGYEDVFSEMKTAAKKLVDLAMNYTFRPDPKIVLNTSEYKIEEVKDKVVAGPYKVERVGVGDAYTFTLDEVKVSLSNQPVTAVITDQNGNRKTSFKENEPFYVMANKSDTSANFNLNVEAVCETLSCGRYGDNSAAQDFATILHDSTSISESVNVTWKKDTGNIVIRKEDQSGSRINGVVFDVKDSSGNRIAQVTTNADGKIDLKNIPTGKYTITETYAPKGYIQDNSPRSLIVSAGDTVTTTYSNTKIAGKLEIIKKDTNGDPIANAKFDIYDSNKKKIQTIITARNGIAISDELDLGTYTYREVEVPDEYILDRTERKFTINDYNQTVTQNITNELVNGSLKITKVDGDNEPLSGVKFNILDSNKKRIETITTNSSGVAISKELEPGDYYYQEIAPKSDDYIFDDSPKAFTIKTSGKVVSRVVVNELKKGSLKILKIDNNKNPIENVTFEIYDKYKNKIDTLITNSKGIATSTKELTLGKYYYKEVSAPDNVKMDATEHEFTVKSDGEVIELTVTNELIKGQLKIVKKDPNNKPIENASFDILDSTKNVIQTITTDANGIAISEKLENGTYYYKETKVPDMYALDSTEHEFTINDTNSFVQETVENKLKSSKLVLHKINKDDGKPIENIRFEILNSDNKIIQSITTNQEGVAETDDLVVGTYYYKEVSAPDNIAMDNTVYEFKIKDENVNVEKTIYNVLKKLPVTGSLFSTNVIIVIVIALSCIVLYIVIKMIIAYIYNRNNN